MPGNTVKINNVDELEWYVGDSKMDSLIEYLDKFGVKNEDSNVIDFETKQTKRELLEQWLEELVYPGKPKDFVQEKEGESKPGLWRRVFYLYTDEYHYQIVAIDRDKDDGYLGCQVSSRKPRAGEDWTRGNDLPDGPFTRDTWNKILNSMISYELIKLTEYRKPKEAPEEVA
jgi:hypothetical protein